MATIHTLHPEVSGQHLKIQVVGAGGNGSQMLTGLARMHLALRAVGHPGIYELCLSDPDTVTDSNVGRQLFSPADVGRYKAEVLVHRINCFYGLNWKARPSMYEDNDEVDFLIGCVDTIAARRSLARSHPHYWLDLGNRDRTGQVILGQPPGAHNSKDATRPRTIMEHFPELKRAQKEDTAPSCSLAEALGRQDLFINQAVVTWALHLLWTFIRSGRLVHQGYFINLETGRVVPVPITPISVPPDKPKKPKGKPLCQVLRKKG